MELDEEKRQVNQRLAEWPWERLQREGLMLLGMKCEKRGAFYGKSVMVFSREQGGNLPFHRFG